VGTVRELEIQLQLALQDFNQVNNLYQRHVVSLGELQRTRGKVLLVAAALEGLDDDFSDELDRLKLEMKKKAAELHETEAQKEVAISVVARSARLNERRPGTVSEFDVAKAGAELKVADAQIEVKRVEMEELALQGGRLTRRRDRIREAMKLSARARAEIDANLPSAKVGGLAPETPRP